MTKISGWPGTVRSGPTTTRPTRSFSTPSHLAADEEATPAAQMMVAASRRSSSMVTPRASHSDTGLPRRTSTCRRSSERSADSLKRRREGRQHARTRFDQHDARVARIDGAEVVAQRDVGELGDGARHLHARRAGADHDEGEEAPARLGIVGLLGLLEGRQDAAADAGGVVDLLQPRRHALPFVMAEIGVPRAGGQHQHVVGDLAILELHDATLAVDAGHAAQDHPHVGRLAQDRADGLGDLRRRQAGRGHLIEQRLEEMVVAPVDDRDVGIGAGEARCSTQAAETGADDDDVRTGHWGHYTGRRDSRRTSQRVRGPNSVSVK